ncbi:MAG: hypothetical protein IKF80_07665 [Erysipelotrichaceae bacterium]|nr:hypothetical protein [Erysipelotrichaceae bacterium]
MDTTALTDMEIEEMSAFETIYRILKESGMNDDEATDLIARFLEEETINFMQCLMSGELEEEYEEEPLYS